MVCHWEFETFFLAHVDEVVASVLFGWRFGSSFLFRVGKTVKKERKKERNGYDGKKTPGKGQKTVVFLQLQYAVCFSPSSGCLLSKKLALLPLLPPAGCAHCLPTGQIYHPKSVSEQFLLLAAWEGVLFALPKCSQGLMLRCYVQTISTVMNHVLPPLCFYFCTRCFFSFWANTLEFPCLLLTQCMSGTRHRLSYSCRPTADMISKSISHSRSCRPFVLPATKGKLIQHSLK